MAANPTRLAKPEDEAALLDLLLGPGGLRAANNTFAFQVDDARVAEHIHLGTRSKGGFHGIIDAPDKPGVLAASVGIVFDRWWFSSEWGLAQIWLFVRPEYRGGTHYADYLVEWAKEIRDKFEAEVGQKVRMANTIISEEKLESKLRFWRRHSGKMIGAVFEIT